MRPDIVRTDSFGTVIAQLGLHLRFRRLVPELYAQLPVNAIDFLDIGAPALAVKEHRPYRPPVSQISLICFISVGSKPACFFVQSKQVGWPIPALRLIPATGVPSSLGLMMNAFCASENFDAFM